MVEELRDDEARDLQLRRRASYDAEKRQALEAWTRRLHQIVTGEPAAKVVPIRS